MPPHNKSSPAKSFPQLFMTPHLLCPSPHQLHCRRSRVAQQQVSISSIRSIIVAYTFPIYLNPIWIDTDDPAAMEESTHAVGAAPEEAPPSTVAPQEQPSSDAAAHSSSNAASQQSNITVPQFVAPSSYLRVKPQAPTKIKSEPLAQSLSPLDKEQRQGLVR